MHCFALHLFFCVSFSFITFVFALHLFKITFVFFLITDFVAFKGTAFIFSYCLILVQNWPNLSSYVYLLKFLFFRMFERTD